MSFVYVCHDRAAASPTASPSNERTKICNNSLNEIYKTSPKHFCNAKYKNVNIRVNKAATSVIYCAPHSQRLQRAPLNYLSMDMAYVSVGHFNDAATFGDSLHIICNCIRKSWRFWFPSAHIYVHINEKCMYVCGKFFMPHTLQRLRADGIRTHQFVVMHLRHATCASDDSFCTLSPASTFPATSYLVCLERRWVPPFALRHATKHYQPLYAPPTKYT